MGISTAETIARALKGRKIGRGWMARCPAHDDSKPSLSIKEANGKILVHCFAGCDQGLVIAALKARGLWGEHSHHQHHRFMRPEPRTIADQEKDQSETRRTEMALAIWQAAAVADGTLVETYFVSRGLRSQIPSALRFHTGLKHPTGGVWPAMVALVTHGLKGTPVGIHRTFLARDGNGKAAVDPAKMMLGPCRGGVVRLGDPGDVLMIGEGIETCLAAMLASGRPAWAALSTSGLRGVDLPKDVRDVILLADGDDPGEAAARDAALRWHQEERRVRIARPPRGADFNDMLLGTNI